MTFWRKKKESELDEEVRSHLRLAAEDRTERGQESGAAAEEVRREFGNVELVKETARDSWSGRWVADLVEDIRFGVRVLRKNPGFTAIAILTLTLGIGANSALFSVVNAVLLNPLPYPHSEELVTVHESKPNFDSGSISFPNFLDWQKENRSFSAMGASRPFGFSLTGLGEAEQVNARFVTADFFRVLGVNPILGRNFTKGEDLVGGAPITMISAGLWRRKFSASPYAVGKPITLGGKSYTIVGIVPANFDLYLRSANQAEVFIPMGQWANPILMRRDAGLGIHGVARLKPGVTIEQARADMARLTDNLAIAYPKEDKGIGASLFPMRESLLGDIQPILLMLLAAVGFVLLIACVNVANLLLARSTARKREFAIRAALGAGRQRIVRQLLTESVLLSLCGGVLGLLFAQLGTRTAVSMLPVDLPRSSSIELDTKVFLFTLGLSLLAGVLFGLVPALKTSHLGLNTELKESSRNSSDPHNRAQGVLVVLEMAMALVLLVGAGLTIRSLTLLWKVDPGFRPDNVMTFNLAFPHTMNDKSPQAIRSIIREVDRQFASIPGVDGVSQTWGAIPIGSEDDQQFWFADQPKPADPNGMGWTLDYIVEQDYLKIMGIPLLRGRFFSDQDTEHTTHVAVVDEVFAHKYFPAGDPIGKRVALNTSGDILEIVGVVGHVNQWGLGSDEAQPLRAQMYMHCMQMPDDFVSTTTSGTTMILHSRLPRQALLSALHDVNQKMSKEQVLFGEQSMDEIIALSLGSQRFIMMLLGAFAALALVLASVGIYGVISYLVGQRTREIGVRMAMGAQKGDVLRLILGQGMKMTLLGVAIGLGVSVVLTRLMTALLYGIGATDPITFIGVGLLLTVVALTACYVPARRALRVDPMTALRYE